MSARYVLIGSGIAALSAAESIRQHDASALITLISEEPHPFYSRPGLAYLLRGDFPEKHLYLRNPQDLRLLNLERIQAVVQNISIDRREVLLAKGKPVPYDRLLLATGALATPPTFPGGDLKGVVRLDSLNECRDILKQTRKGQPAIVVGGGITALELAEGLAAQGMKVRYFLRGDRYWSDVLDETESHIVQKRLAHEGVTIHTQTQVKEARGPKGTLAEVETQKGEVFPCKLLAVAIGVKPRMDLAQKAGLKTDRGILVDPYLQTSQPGIFAAGDCCQVVDPATGKGLLDVLWPTALAQGRLAGANMAGAGLVYVKGTPCNVTQLAGLKVTIIGTVGGAKEGEKDRDLVAINRGDSETWRLLPRALVFSEHDSVNRVRLVINDNKIVGALVMGDQAWSRPLQRLISAQVDISPVRPALAEGGKRALEQLAGFYLQWNQLPAKQPQTLIPARREK